MRQLPLLLLLIACGAPNGDGTPTPEPEPTPAPDTDGDGIVDAEDCAPEDAAIFPGATEVCNGVDDDCDGELLDNEHGEDPATDTDGDGVTPCDLDCDDDEPAIYPGAPEQADRKDDDCNGIVDDCPWTGSAPRGVQGPDSAFATFVASDSRAGESVGHDVAGPGDVNGDGYDDIMMARRDGEAWLFHGPFCPGEYDVELADVVFPRRLYGIEKLKPVGDLNDDGYVDVRVGEFIWLGPLQSEERTEFGGLVLRLEQADYSITADTVLAPGDVNGDGFPDLVAGVAWGGGPGAVYVHYGPFPPQDERLHLGPDDADVTLRGETIFNDSGLVVPDNAGGSLASLGDADGDGLPDLAVGASLAQDDGGSTVGAVYLVHGPLDADGDLLELGVKLHGSRAGGNHGILLGVVSIDGEPTLAVSEYGPYPATLYLVEGGQVEPGALDQIGVALGGEENMSMQGRAIALGDFDGDGTDDFALGNPLWQTVENLGLDGLGAILIFYEDGDIRAAPPPHLLDADGVSTPETQLGTSISSAGDVNGDTAPDLLAGSQGGGAARPGRAYLWLGGARGR